MTIVLLIAYMPSVILNQQQYARLTLKCSVPVCELVEQKYLGPFCLISRQLKIRIKALCRNKRVAIFQTTSKLKCVGKSIFDKREYLAIVRFADQYKSLMQFGEFNINNSF